jgi:hypothetical protein
MRRGFYLALGATVGVLIVRRLNQAAESMAPNAVMRSIAASVGSFVADVREGMAEAEGIFQELLEAEIPASGETSGSL